MGSAYEKDFYAWANEQAALLRSGKLAEADIEHIAEEIESMGKAEKRELVAGLTVLLLHLLKWRLSAQSARSLLASNDRSTAARYRRSARGQSKPEKRSVGGLHARVPQGDQGGGAGDGAARDDVSDCMPLELRAVDALRLLAGLISGEARPSSRA